MDNTYYPALQWLILNCTVSTDQDYQSAANAIMVASKKFPTFYREHPIGEVQTIQKEIFRAEALATYLENKVGRNELATYQQDVVRKLMQLRRMELKY